MRSIGMIILNIIISLSMLVRTIVDRGVDQRICIKFYFIPLTHTHTYK